MTKPKCTGLNCPAQYTYAEPEKCPYATFPRTNADLSGHGLSAVHL